MLLTLVASATDRILICLVAAVALAVTAALARAHGRRLERRKAAELGRRRGEPLSVRPGALTEPAGASPSDEPVIADAELRITLDELLARRDALLEEFQGVQADIQVVKREVERRRRIIPATVPVVEAGGRDADVIELPSAEPDEERSEHRR